MPTSATKERLDEGLLSFAWDEWSQLGILSERRRASPWAQDLEALLVFTFEVARSDPRLFDEVLDWLVTNEHHVSVRRLRTLSRQPEDQALTNAVLTWLAQHRPIARPRVDPVAPAAELTPLHAGAGFPVRRRDEAFAAHGWLRATTAPSGRSQNPDLREPIAFGLRLRQLLGVSARAEVMRLLLTTGGAPLSTTGMARSAGYARRNVQEALHALEQAGVVSGAGARRQGHHVVSKDRWAALLDLEDGFPAHQDWVHLLAGLSRVRRWLSWASEHKQSDYLLASAALDLLNDVRQDFEHAGVVIARNPTAAGALEAVDDVVAQSLKLLTPG